MKFSMIGKENITFKYMWLLNRGDDKNEWGSWFSRSGEWHMIIKTTDRFGIPDQEYFLWDLWWM